MCWMQQGFIGIVKEWCVGYVQCFYGFVVIVVGDVDEFIFVCMFGIVLCMYVYFQCDFYC